MKQDDCISLPAVKYVIKDTQMKYLLESVSVNLFDIKRELNQLSSRFN